MRIFKKYPLLVLFAAFLLVLSIADMFVSHREFSEMENRYLAQKPKMTVDSLLATEENQKYSYKYESYVNDQFIGRDGWITLKSISESALGKIENNGIVYGKDHYLFENYQSTNEERIEKTTGFGKTFLEQSGDRTDITMTIIPSSYAILEELLPAGLHNVDQQDWAGRISDEIGSGAAWLDLFPVMDQAASNGQAYYRTDHHWTTYGAYCGYRAFVESCGLKAVELSELEPLRHEVPDFYGSYYSKCKLFSTVPDVITWYDIPFTSMTIDGEERESLYEASKWEERDKHAAFLWGNNGVTVIKSENNLNHVEGKTSRVLVIKDSFGNSMTPFLTYSYDEVYVVDLRSLPGKMSELMAQTSFDDVLVMYNFMNYSSDTNIPRMTY